MAVSRKTIEELFIRQIETFMPPEQVEDARRLFAMLSDEEFLELCAEALRDNGIIPPSMSPQEMMDAINMLAFADDNQVARSVDILPQKDARPYWHIIDRAAPPCTISLLRCEDIELTDSWRKEQSSPDIPSDILLAGTIPAANILLEIDGSFMEDAEFFRFRVLIFPDYTERIRTAGLLNETVIGAVIITLEPGSDFFIPFAVMQGMPDILLRPIGCRTAAMAARLRKDPRFNLAMLHKVGTAVLETWYGIQQKLLHPCDDYMYLYLLECTAPDDADILYKT